MSASHAALVAAYRDHGDALFGFARRRLAGNSALAEDVVQETFLRAWRSLRRFDPNVATMRQWLFVICRNAASDAGQADARQRRVDAAIVGTAADRADDVIDHLVARCDAEVALAALPTRLRDAVVAVHVCDRPLADVAGELAIPVGTVKSRVHTGLRRARAALVA